MKRVIPPTTLALLITLATSTAALAADVNGAWKWSQPRPDGEVVQITLTLKQDGEKVTGTFHGHGPDSEVTEGTLRGDTLNFRVIRDVDGHKITMDYTGKVDGNSIKGHVTMKAGLRERKEGWEAKRDEEKGGASHVLKPSVHGYVCRIFSNTGIAA